MPPTPRHSSSKYLPARKSPFRSPWSEVALLLNSRCSRTENYSRSGAEAIDSERSAKTREPAARERPRVEMERRAEAASVSSGRSSRSSPSLGVDSELLHVDL